jgi:hypothetical protein
LSITRPPLRQTAALDLAGVGQGLDLGHDFLAGLLRRGSSAPGRAAHHVLEALRLAARHGLQHGVAHRGLGALERDGPLLQRHVLDDAVSVASVWRPRMKKSYMLTSISDTTAGARSSSTIGRGCPAGG